MSLRLAFLLLLLSSASVRIRVVNSFCSDDHTCDEFIIPLKADINVRTLIARYTRDDKVFFFVVKRSERLLQGMSARNEVAASVVSTEILCSSLWRLIKYLFIRLVRLFAHIQEICFMSHHRIGKCKFFSPELKEGDSTLSILLHHLIDK